MAIGLFDSGQGSMIHYFIRPDDDFVLNTLEKLDADAYLYRVLRGEGFEQIFFINIDESNCSVWAFDKLSYWASVKSERFATVDMRDPKSVADFLEWAEGGEPKAPEGEEGREKAPKQGLNLKLPPTKMVKNPDTSGNKPARKAVPPVGRSRMLTFGSPGEFVSFMAQRIRPALKAKNAKTAIVMPVELFEKGGYLAESVIETIRYAQKHNTAKNNLIVMTTPWKSNILKCFNYPNLHYWTTEVISQQSSDVSRVDAAINELRNQGVLVLVDKICADEIANLLLRKKLIEKDPRFDALQISKVYGLAELLAEHCAMEKKHFKSLKPFKMHDFIRQLEHRFQSDEVCAELVEKSWELQARAPKSQESLDALALERVTGRHIARYELSEAEMMHDFNVAMEALQSLIGLEKVKTRIQRQLNTVRAYGGQGGPGHYIFTGSPGTGKTEVARLMGSLFKAMGRLKKGHLVECKKTDLVAEHVGGSSVKTRKKCEEALDGVLFVDEAYLLVNTEPTGEKFSSAFDEEAYTEIMTFMDNNRDRVCVIFAGYPEEMRRFREANPGMPGRIGESNIIHFDDYNADELFRIFVRFAQRDTGGFTLSPEFEQEIRQVIERMVKGKRKEFDNARAMRTLFSRCKECAAQRFVQTGNEALKFTLTVDDIPEDLYQRASESEFETAMAALQDLIGLENVKNRIRRQLNMVLAYGGEGGPGHYIFTGSPGTGKTEVARLMGRLFKAMGRLSKGHLVECKKTDLVSDHVGGSSIKTRNKCEEALDGVLFVDEAYLLVNTEPTGEKFSSAFDEEAYTEIMTFMDNNRDRVCVIFAGYPEEMRRFRVANPGMPGRIGESNIIHFDDYNADELFRIFVRFAQRDTGGFTLSPEFEQEIRQVIEKMVKGKQKEFDNARAMRTLFSRCKECAAQRFVQTGNEDLKFTLTADDIPEDLYQRASESEFETAMAALNEMIGLQNVKETLCAILDTKLIYEDEKGPGHYVFAGNPGTGKTDVAKKLGAIFKAMGMLSSGHVVDCRKADLVADVVGQSSIKARQKCEEALDGVLFVDEAYELVNTEPTGEKFASKFDEEAYTEIMAFMENNRHRVCVIFAGYSNLMEKFLDANDGMRSRVSNVIQFPDYTVDELVQILALMAKKEGFSFGPGFEEAARKAIDLRKKECVGKFANAREVRVLLGKFKQNVAGRMKQLRFEHRWAELNEQKFVLTPEDALVGSMKEEQEDVDVAMEDLNALIGLHAVKEQVRSIKNKILYSSGSSKRIEPGHYIFAGNPGTGKTEVARLMGRIFKAIGVLSKSTVVEVTRNDLVAGYVGQTAIKTMDRCKEALGGVLFVDEAYTLYSSGSERDFGKEALDTIMKFMEDNRDRICVIFAGYEEPMKKLMEVNEGFDSRITGIIHFPDYSVEELVRIMHFMAAKQDLELAEDFVEKARKLIAYRVANKTETFGNAREVRKMLNAADGRRANRIAEAVESGQDPSTIQMNLLVAADLGPDKQPDSNRENAPKAPGTERIPGAPIQNLAPLYSEDVCNDKIKLSAATDSAVLFVKTDKGYGTAYLISPEGYALTCNHVISGAAKIEARFRMPGRPGGADSWHNCKVVNTKVDLDMALIKLEGENFPYLPLASEDRVIRKGEEFILSGYPFGKRTEKDLTTYQGYVASTERQTDENGLIRYNIGGEAKSGNSGSPLIALEDGRVIGMLLGSMTERSGETLTEEINYMRPIQYFWEEFVN